MHYKLYIDILFLENFMMDSLILIAIQKILAIRQSVVRSFAGGATGSILTCLVIAVQLRASIRGLLFHTIINTVMLMTGLHITSRRRFIQAFLLLYLCSIAIGGIMQIFRPWLRGISLFFGCTIVCWCLGMQGWKLLNCFAVRRKQMPQVLLYAKGQKIAVRALADTGNVLTDPLTGAPVSILSDEVYKSIEKNETGTDLTKENTDTGEEAIRYIPYQYIGGTSVIKIVRIEKMCVCGTEELWVEHPLIGISDVTFGREEEYQMILNQRYIK